MTTQTTQSAPVQVPNPGPGCLVRGLYFIFVGSWLGLIWILAAWFFNLTIIGLPLGLAMINRIPQIMTLRPVRVQTTVEVRDGAPVVRQTYLKQPPFILRALYFIVIGFWFSLVWMVLAWLFTGLTLGLGLPLAFWMFDRVPAVTTLARV
ncbi:MAG: YccF domain-containing protein [Anaerolineaceae bacterium]|nr:YccF domain-containing protein [Anaerolineaceae bacterium]